jgi:hypothetical protein
VQHDTFRYLSEKEIMAMTDSIVFGLDPGNADDHSVQEGAAAAKRSITRSLMAIDCPDLNIRSGQSIAAWIALEE